MSVKNVFVRNDGRDPILTDYNGKRYHLQKGIVAEMPQEAYHYLVASRTVDPKTLVICDAPVVSEPEIKKKPQKQAPNKKDKKGKK